VLKIKNILVSQPKPEDGKSPYYDVAEKYNVKIEFRPFIKVETVSTREFRNQRINIPDYSAVVFTSRTGIDNFFALSKEMRVPRNEEIKYFCISEAVAFYLQKHINFRKRRVFYGNGKLADMISIISKHETEIFLFVLPENNNEEIFEHLKTLNVAHQTAIVYRVVSNDFTENENFDYDMIIFFSPQGIVALQKNFPNFVQGEIAIGCLGASAAQAVKDAGFRVDLEVPNPQFSSMTSALDHFLKQNRKNLKTEKQNNE
jgi:uroporphyrinogen-III synthase